jgi:cytochrome c-type biogenesis protein
MYKQYRPKGLIMLGINVRWDAEPDARAFVTQYGVPYPVGRDTSGDIARRYRIDGTPATFLINRDGTLFGRADGAMSESQLVGNIEAILKKK